MVSQTGYAGLISIPVIRQTCYRQFKEILFNERITEKPDNNMKTLITLIICLALISCETKNVKTETIDTSIEGWGLNIYTIDSCEYIGKVSQLSISALTHKGNCKFCKQRSLKP